MENTAQQPASGRGRTSARLAAAALMSCCLAWGTTTSVTANTDAVQDHWLTLAEMGFEAPVPAQAQESIRVYEIGSPIAYSAEGSIKALETTEEEAGETIISLSSDILFTPDSWELSANAGAKIEELISDVPEGADLAIHGHTDSIDGAVDNKELSEKRAGAVADAVRSVRSDLTLDVQGFADTRPKKRESGPDDDEARRINRRVELRYEGR
ncbi:OmpA family protein [Pseudactinotalea sp. HY158]|uniref:OmpA family protein n=1 Tax=Pseudactinotalea sp. HY158 TaxID=2654547 RepID=UPI00129CAA84|nr:OmpA family protein [Pseudactinotalea sp. HY158]QGH68186.1 OmpA family protein [Pseudactinotalea sp. HY158]